MREHQFQHLAATCPNCAAEVYTPAYQPHYKLSTRPCAAGCGKELCEDCEQVACDHCHAGICEDCADGREPEDVLCPSCEGAAERRNAA